MCKGCSLVVQPGYPKCPRCKMPLPRVEAPLATATKASQVKGGTAIAAESSLAIPLTIGAVALAGIVAAALIAGGDSSADESSGAAPVDTLVTSENRTDPGVREDPAIGISLETEEPGNDEQRRLALTRLDQELSDARLWSTVSVDGSEDAVISVVSSACEQEDMQPTLLASAEPLRAVGFTAVRCVAKHGAQVFELAL